MPSVMLPSACVCVCVCVQWRVYTCVQTKLKLMSQILSMLTVLSNISSIFWYDTSDVCTSNACNVLLQCAKHDRLLGSLSEFTKNFQSDHSWCDLFWNVCIVCALCMVCATGACDYSRRSHSEPLLIWTPKTMISMAFCLAHYKCFIANVFLSPNSLIWMNNFI